MHEISPAWLAMWTNKLTLRKYKLATKKLSRPVSVLLLSDLHGAGLGAEQEKLFKNVRQINPDFVLLAGDIVDDELPYPPAFALLKKLGKNYPCFYVTGNHEFWCGRHRSVQDRLNEMSVEGYAHTGMQASLNKKAYRLKNSLHRDGGTREKHPDAYPHGVNSLKRELEGLEITVLEGKCATINIKGARFNICGVDDPVAGEDVYIEQLAAVKTYCRPDAYNILIAHRPERIEQHLKLGFDLVVSGHAHGGQWRLPGLVNGVFAPNQGIFPRYAGGLYRFEETSLVVSRGACKKNTRVPRIFNPPELVVINIMPN
ncbi:metallophosphoesterase [Eubacteriales bacterium OttesenSCG-928-K08]|nr:metallophosphoesterase [Eubacteriales bacterium OttesenSCG-928-K08]